MDEQQLRNLLERYRNGTATEHEKALLESWYVQFREDGDLAPYSPEDIIRDASSVWSALESDARAKSVVPLWRRLAAAAVVLVFLSVGGYFLFHRDAREQIAQNKTVIKPGRDQAILTLADGRKIVLTKNMSGVLARQDGATVQISRSGELAYTARNETPMKIAYNTLSTALGEQSPIPLILPDGSKVWLNALSSVTFPTTFKGKERRVKVTGEAMFEISHKPDQPFYVEAGGQEIKDIGTRFDVNVYNDEPDMRTTLVEGSVEVFLKGSAGKTGVRLVPGQQSVMKSGNIMVVKADLDQALAWTKGDFVFDGESLGTIMRQISRWYQVDVVYKENTSSVEFGGSISRTKNIKEVLDVLETKGVHFQLEGRRVIVMP